MDDYQSVINRYESAGDVKENCFGMSLDIETTDDSVNSIFQMISGTFNPHVVYSISEFLEKGNPETKDMEFKYQVFAKKLALLMHAFLCDSDHCPTNFCTTLKKTWCHIATCEPSECDDPDCRTSRQLLLHWIECEDFGCVVCHLFKRPLRDRGFSSLENDLGVQTRKSKNLKEWSGDELRSAFIPIMNRMFMYEKESAPFMKPVDPEQEQCPDYFAIIRKPIDFGTICDKLEKDVYKGPWEIVDDINRVFGNAWLYNKKCSIYHKYACKLADVFETHVDVVMKNLGFCCGQRYEFTPLPKYCDSRLCCNIPVLSDYFSYNNEFSFCERCFAESPGCQTVSISKDLKSEPLVIEKKHFIKTRNLERKLERFVKCENCGRLNHVICVRYLENNTTPPFICHLCMSDVNVYKPITSRAKDIPSNKLSEFIESRVRSFFQRKKVECGEVSIRVIASSKETTTVKPRFKKHFPQMAEEYQYIAKAIFAFQDVGDQDVCFFGMHVQEYGSKVPAPNTRRVYLAYLDSVQYFEPRAYRTPLYHEILLAYMQYIRNLGYTSLHIWSCPPCEGDDYIFNCHPPKQKIPKARKLREWYKNLLEKATSENIVVNFTDILSYAVSNDLKNAADMPYFDGDFWPTSLEDNIKDIEKNECISERNSTGKPSRSEESSTNQKPQNRGKRVIPSTHGDLLVDKIYSTLGKYREMFFVVEFLLEGPPASISDPDPLMPNDSMHERSSFLIMSREKQAEFSSLRRAKHSTLIMLYEVLNPSNHIGSAVIQNNPSCTICGSKDGVFHICRICQSWKCCSRCFTENIHPHKTELLSTTPGKSGVTSLEHASTCRDDRCVRQGCRNFKAAFSHAVVCDNKVDCKCCRTLIRLVILHSKKCPIESAPPQESGFSGKLSKRRCIDLKCPVVFCKETKAKLAEAMLKQRKIEDRMLMRRTAAMMEEENEGDAGKQEQRTDFQRMGSI